MIDKASLQTEGEPPFAPNGLLEPQFLSDNSHSRDRGGTYLHCCTLLI
jgi:hypothetical protein